MKRLLYICKNKYMKKYDFKAGDMVTSSYIYVSEDLVKTTSNHRYINVVCKCGNKSSIRTDAILKNASCSVCGQVKRRNTFTEKTKESLKKRLFSAYERQAKKRNYSFEISYDHFKHLIFQNCFYCDDEPSNKFLQNYRTLIYNGVDRVDSNIGYTLENTVACCAQCNWMKNKFTKKQFLDKVKKIHNNLKL